MRTSRRLYSLSRSGSVLSVALPLIRTSQRMLDELLQRQVPVLRPFANLQMQREFAKLTERLRAAEAP